MRKPSATLIGLFVIGAAALIVAAILFFGRGALLEQRIPFVSFFQGSVGGLQVGAPVTFRGVRVGDVRTIGIRIDPKTDRSIVQVDMELLPDTVKVYGAQLSLDRDYVPTLVQRGLTAQLVRQSFVTGLLNIELDFRPGTEVLRLGDPSTAPEVPSVPTGLQAITRKLETVDIAAALEAIQQTLASLNAVLSSPELAHTIRELPGLVADLRRTLITVDRETRRLSATGHDALAGSATAMEKTLISVQSLAATLDRETASTLAAARGTLDSASTTLDGTQVLLDPRGRTMLQVQRAVDDLAATAARLRNIAERVDRDPSILIRGR